MHIKLMLITIFISCFFSVAGQKKTNVVLILTDDQGWGDLSIHGNPFVETPQLDKLAKSGKRFNNFYVSPLCAPSRASILTGRDHLKTGVVSVSKGMETMDTDETTLAELFKANGYATGIFGKWHNGAHYPNRPNDQGFDEFLGFCAGHWSNYFNTDLTHNDKSVKTKGFITDVLTDAALKFIAKNKQNPFFCYIPYNAPHSPHQVPDKYFNKYKAKSLSDELASIYGMVENVDDNVGRIINYLEKNQLEENTIVIFMSDNGPNGIRFNGDLRGIKGSVHEGGVRVPFFISWKAKITPGKIIQTPVAHIDLYSTLSDLCQLKAVPGKPLDGKSFASLVWENGNAIFPQRNIYTHVNFMDFPVKAGPGGFRNEQYRFVFENDKVQLFDLLQDPREENDIAKQKPELCDQYLSDYKAWFTTATDEVNYERPIVLSHSGLELPAYEATLSPGIKFKEGHGWANDWVEKWDNIQDSIYWEIDCENAGNYVISLDYLLDRDDIGSRILCRVAGDKKIITLHEHFYSEVIASPDRVLRKEAYEVGRWKSLILGTFYIPKGKNIVLLKALAVKNRNVAEVKGVRLKLGED